MGVRKTLVRVGNVIYLAGAALAIYGMCTQPLIHLGVNMTVSGEVLGEVLGGALNKGGSKSKAYTTKAPKRADTPDIMSYMTPEKIKECIPELKLNVNIDVPAAACFDLNNKNVLGDIIKNNIDAIADGAVDQMAPKLTSLISSVAQDLAGDVLKSALASAFGGDGDGESVEFPAETKAILDDTLDEVFGLIGGENAGPVSAETFVDTLLSGGVEKEGQIKSAEKSITGLTVVAKEKSAASEMEKVKSLEIGGSLTYTNYRINEDLRMEGLTVTAKDSANQPVEIKNGDYKLVADKKVSTSDNTSGGSIQDIKVHAELLSDSSIKSEDKVISASDITVKAESEKTTIDSVTSIKIEGTPTLTTYNNGDAFYADGLTVIANDGAVTLQDGDYEFDVVPSKLSTDDTSVKVVAKLVHTGKYTSGVLGVLTSLQENAAEDFPDLQGLDIENIPTDVISGGIMGALTSMPGLATTDPETGEVVINDLSSALGQLLGSFLGGGGGSSSGDDSHQEQQTPEQPQQGEGQGGEKPTPEPTPEHAGSHGSVTRAITRDGDTAEAQSSEDMIKDVIKKLIPDMSSIDFSFGGIVNYVLIGLIGLGCLPWILFALFTLIRTLRPKKCWAKPWFIFVFCFLELILGAGLYFGIKYGLAIALPYVEGMVPAPYNALLAGVSIDFKMSCYWASLVYLAMIPFTIIYAIIAHPVKKDFKQFKKDKKAAKKAGLSLQEYLDQKNGKSVESAIKTSSTKKEAKAAAKIAKEKK